MKITIEPRAYARIAHQHNRVALTMRAIGRTREAEYHVHKRDVTMCRARSVREQLNAKVQDISQ